MEKVLDIFEAATPRDKVLTYLKSNRKAEMYLSEVEVRYMEQLDYCDDIIRNNRTMRPAQYINMVVEKFQVSTSTARNLILDAKYVHGSMSKPVKAYERQLMTEVLWEMWNDNKKGSPKVALGALELIAKINALDIEDEDTGEDDGVKNIIIRPVFSPETLGVPNPENLDELVENLRKRTAIHKKSTESLTE